MNFEIKKIILGGLNTSKINEEDIKHFFWFLYELFSNSFFITKKNEIINEMKSDINIFLIFDKIMREIIIFPLINKKSTFYLIILFYEN